MCHFFLYLYGTHQAYIGDSIFFVEDLASRLLYLIGTRLHICDPISTKPLDLINIILNFYEFRSVEEKRIDHAEKYGMAHALQDAINLMIFENVFFFC